MTNLSQTHVEVRGVRDGTVRNDLVWLRSLFNFASGYRINGKPLLATNPMHGLTLPTEPNVRRPVASEERYRKTLEKADAADPRGRLACVLALSRYTGRRIGAICHLRASDVLLSTDAIGRTLASLGVDPSLARHMPHGAVRWRAEHDKQRRDAVVPISTGARAAIDRYLRAQPRVGDAWLFAQVKTPTRPMTSPDTGCFASARNLWRGSRSSSVAGSIRTDGSTRSSASICRTSTSRTLPAGVISRR